MDNQTYTDREEQKRNLRRGMMVNEEGDYEAALKAHRRKRTWIIILILVLAAAAAAGWFIYDKLNTYRKFEEGWNQTIENANFDGAVSFGSGLIKYGKNAASYVDSTGTIIWTESYEMSSPQVITKGGYALIFDQGSSEMRICNETGKQGQVTTAAPISRAALGEQGMAVVILEDPKAEYIAFYDKSGRKLQIEIKTRLQGDGFPVDLALSPSGEQLMVSYIYVENATLKNKIVFYNFDVGQDMIDRIVGGFEQYENTIVPRVLFLNEKQAAAVGDNVISFYSLKNKLRPELAQEIELTQEIQAVFYGNEKIGLVMQSENPEMPWKLQVFDGAGTTVSEFEMKDDFDKIEFVEDEILVYNEAGLCIYTLNGDEKFRYDTSYDLQAAVPGSQKRIFYLIGNGMLQEMRIR